MAEAVVMDATGELLRPSLAPCFFEYPRETRADGNLETRGDDVNGVLETRPREMSSTLARGASSLATRPEVQHFDNVRRRNPMLH